MSFQAGGCRIGLVQNWKDLRLKINISKWNYWILRIGVIGRCWKLGISLWNNVTWKLMLPTNVNNKNVLLNWYSLIKKKNEKYSDDFWHRKLTLKAKLRHVLTPFHYTNSQNSKISFDYVDFLAKIFRIMYPFAWKFNNPYCHNAQSFTQAHRFRVNFISVCFYIASYIFCFAILQED